MRVLLVGLSLCVAAAPAAAQELRPIPSKFVNDQRFEITEFELKVTPTGCEGSQHYTKVGDHDNNGVGLFRYPNAVPWMGGTLCSQGVWFGKTGEFGGKLENVLVKGGKSYWLR